jgi:hypothetical protein
MGQAFFVAKRFRKSACPKAAIPPKNRSANIGQFFNEENLGYVGSSFRESHGLAQRVEFRDFGKTKKRRPLLLPMANCSVESVSAR